MLVLDTNVLSELMRPQPATQVTAWLRSRGVHALRTTAISRAEIRYGIARLDAGTRRQALAERAESVFGEISELILDFDSRAADVYGDLVARRQGDGRPISVLDAQIAAITRVHGGELVSRNVADFEGCGLTVHDPWGALPPRPRR